MLQACVLRSKGIWCKVWGLLMTQYDEMEGVLLLMTQYDAMSLPPFC